MESCRCQKDFETLTGRFNSIFKNIKNKREKDLLNKTLSAIGIPFENNELIINNADLWSQVSMIERRKFQMPSTTNSIESQHGHLNEATPRNNMFIFSIYRLII